MSASENTNLHHHSHSSWYPPDAPQPQAPAHAKQHFYPSMSGNRPPPSNQYPHYPQNHYMYGHHAVPYGNQHHPFHYDAPEETLEDSNTPSEPPSSRRDSFPYYHNYPQQHATPLQPPANVYNGPPVSALVPRFPRGPAMMYAQHGYTPNHSQYESSNQNSMSQCPPSSDRRHEPFAYSRGSMSSNGRRTSFGLPFISTNPSFLIPTPQHPSSGEQNDTSSEGSSPIIPIPPIKKEDVGDTEDRNPQSFDGNKQESRCVNLLSKKFEPAVAQSRTSAVAKMDDQEAPKKPPTVQDASLLLGLSSDASTGSSPATVPTLQEENETGDTGAEETKDRTELIPKTCFPVPIPKNYPRRLSLPNDSIKLNALHCFVRSDLLEIFVVEPSPEALKFRHAPSSSVGRVGLRCVHCFMARNNTMNATRDEEAPMSHFYPKTISEIYRLVTSWQRCHVRKCKNLPKGVREKWNSLRETEKSRGKTAYWVDSAKKIGLIDCTSRMGGIRFDVKEDIVAAKFDMDMKDHEDRIIFTTTDENSEPRSRTLGHQSLYFQTRTNQPPHHRTLELPLRWGHRMEEN
jgi:hypothetical protein